MSIEIYQFGTNPEQEAFRLQKIYQDPGVDEAIIEEFPASVDAYRNLSIDEITERIISRFCGESPSVYCQSIVTESMDIGLIFWGAVDYQHPSSGLEIKGVNPSGWILQQFRGMGLSAYLCHGVNQAREQVNNPGHHFFGRQVWTSIHNQNLASTKRAESFGMHRVGPAVGKAERTIFELSD